MTIDEALNQITMWWCRGYYDSIYPDEVYVFCRGIVYKYKITRV